MIQSIEKLMLSLSKILDESNSNERTLYPVLCNFFQNFGSELKLLDISATSEESLQIEEKNIGFPDITIRQNGRLIGWVEVKLPKDNLNAPKFIEQFRKYQESLENILFINMREWQLWRWDEDGKPKKIAEELFDPLRYGTGEEKKLINILIKFFEGKPYNAKTPLQLAKALAKKARLLSNQVQESLDETNKKNDLNKLKQAFEKTLIQNIDKHQFSNLLAETLTYSLFLAFLEYDKPDKENLTITSAIDFLPTNIPVLSDLYLLITKVSNQYIGVKQSAQLILDQLKFTDIGKIKQKLVKHKPGDDPVIQFYEPFLKEYDSKEREARGVYYTPKPIVDFIIRSVDYLLKDKFDKEDGLSDESVHILDPSTGTGTFLMSAIQTVHKKIYDKWIKNGPDIVKKKFHDITIAHILKHFYAFELLVAPYAIAHLKLTLLLEEYGFNFESTKNDSDIDNDRLKIYLANTLDDPEKKTEDLFGFSSITEESEKARKIKKEVPILAIVGNPPYSNFGQMNTGVWIMKLSEDYKINLNEKKINIDDDYIKFIRFAEWKLKQQGQGIFAMITSNSFIDGITHRQMRKDLLSNFDEVYILNLHGNLRKKETCPDGSKDENVFNIQTGVSINIFIKHASNKKKVRKYFDLWGLRERKFSYLIDKQFSQIEWIDLDIDKFNNEFKNTRWGKNYAVDLNLLIPSNNSLLNEYGNYWGINEIFLKYNSGIITRNDDLTIQFNKTDIGLIIDDFLKLNEIELRNKYKLVDGVNWKISNAKRDIIDNSDKNKLSKILYRPFDIRFTLFTTRSNGFLSRPIYDVMKNLTKPNLALLCKRQSKQDFTYSFISNVLCESCVFESAYANNSVFPLYIYDESSSQMSLLGVQGSAKNVSNISPIFIKEFSETIGLNIIENGQGDLQNTLGPEDIFYYIYAILHNPTYRTRYMEQLKIDFPRVPFTQNKALFKQLVIIGNKLANLHLLGENSFDKSKTILDEPNKWNIKTGGQKTEGLEDWKVIEVRYDEQNKRVYVNKSQFFEGIEKDVWELNIGGYQVCDKWLKERKKAQRSLSGDDLIHFMKIIITLRETIRLMREIDTLIPQWPMK
ncbi:MAG: hypothetical protein ACD_12C00889G0003 [uncultured bacterium]|nr:MAG: hypothetical protein ACD_12C00889G0003 [uncultured bacterium]